MKTALSATVGNVKFLQRLEGAVFRGEEAERLAGLSRDIAAGAIASLTELGGVEALPTSLTFDNTAGQSKTAAIGQYLTRVTDGSVWKLSSLVPVEWDYVGQAFSLSGALADVPNYTPADTDDLNTLSGLLAGVVEGTAKKVRFEDLPKGVSVDHILDGVEGITYGEPTPIGAETTQEARIRIGLENAQKMMLRAEKAYDLGLPLVSYNRTNSGLVVPVYIYTDNTQDFYIRSNWKGGGIVLKRPDGVMRGATSGSVASGFRPMVRLGDGISTDPVSIEDVILEGNSENNLTAQVLAEINPNNAMDGNEAGFAVTTINNSVVPSFVTLKRCEARGFFRSPFLVAATSGYLEACISEDSLTDHLYYVPDAETTENRDQYSVTMVGCVGKGYWGRSGFDISHTTLVGGIVTDVEENPTTVGGSWAVSAANQALGSVIATRPQYGGSAQINGLTVYADAELLDQVSGVARGMRYSGIRFFHTGDKDLVSAGSFTLFAGPTVTPDDIPISDVVIDIKALDLPGGSRFLDSTGAIGDVTARFGVRFHPLAEKIEDAIRVKNAIRCGFTLHAPRAYGGGGVGRILYIDANSSYARNLRFTGYVENDPQLDTFGDGTASGGNFGINTSNICTEDLFYIDLALDNRRGLSQLHVEGDSRVWERETVQDIVPARVLGAPGGSFSQVIAEDATIPNSFTFAHGAGTSRILPRIVPDPLLPHTNNIRFVSWDDTNITVYIHPYGKADNSNSAVTYAWTWEVERFREKRVAIKEMVSVIYKTTVDVVTRGATTTGATAIPIIPLTGNKCIPSGSSIVYGAGTVVLSEDLVAGDAMMYVTATGFNLASAQTGVFTPGNSLHIPINLVSAALGTPFYGIGPISAGSWPSVSSATWGVRVLTLALGSAPTADRQYTVYVKAGTTYPSAYS